MARPKRFTHPDPQVEAETIAEMKRQYHRNKRAERKERGKQNEVCTKCGRNRIGETELCEHHWYQGVAASRLGSTVNASKLKDKMEQQNYLCYYTKKPLIVGVNVSLDHKLSVKNHPEHKEDLDNVVWCLKEINLMKNGMNEDEFISNCSLIADLSRTSTVSSTETINAYG